MITFHALSNCISKVGDTNPHISGVKIFLNSYYGVKISNLSKDTVFCEKTKQALIEFQRFRRLNVTGLLDVETWQAIGKELGIVRFESSFFHTPNYKVLHKLAFGNKFSRMFPTPTHQSLIEYAFLDGGTKYGDIGGRLSKDEVDAIALGSRQTDTYFGHGYGVGGFEIDIPITLIISEAPKHAMTPEGMTVEEAMKKAHEWIQQNTSEARRLQKEQDSKIEKEKQELVKKHQLNNGKPVPTSAPNPYVDSGKMVTSALTAFGKACHTYMDSVSPAHHGWQKYEMPKTVGEYGVKNDIPMFIIEGLQHKSEESAPPTQGQTSQCALYMRGAFLTTFTNKWFKQAVKSESERQKVYDFIKSQGLSWSENFGGFSPNNKNNSETTQTPKISLR